MTRKEAMELNHQEDRLLALGFTSEEAESLRRISMTLRRWFEKECGIDGGCIERNEDTGKVYWHNSYSGKLYPIADRETGARKRLAAIMAKHPTLTAYVQGDPRGCSLYILTNTQLACTTHDINSIYTRGLAVA